MTKKNLYLIFNFILRGQFTKSRWFKDAKNEIPKSAKCSEIQVVNQIFGQFSLGLVHHNNHNFLHHNRSEHELEYAQKCFLFPIKRGFFFKGNPFFGLRF